MTYPVTVRGRWPFPLDMLRYCAATPATNADAKLLQRLSGEFAEDEKMLHEQHTVRLKACGPRYIAEQRWKSFGWEVVGHGEESALPPAIASVKTALLPTVAREALDLIEGRRRAENFLFTKESMLELGRWLHTQLNKPK